MSVQASRDAAETTVGAEVEATPAAGVSASGAAAPAGAVTNPPPQEANERGTTAAATPEVTDAAPAPAPEAPKNATENAPEAAHGTPASPLTAVRLLLKPNKRGSGVSGEVGHLARTLNLTEADFLATLATAGVVRPTDPEQKPDFIELDSEIYWLNQNPTDGSLWLNAKASRRAAGRRREESNESE